MPLRDSKFIGTEGKSRKIFGLKLNKMKEWNENPGKYSVRIQKSEIQMVDYKIPENIRFEFDPQKLGVSYSIMSGRWFGGMRMGLRRAGCSKDEKTDTITIIWCDGVEMFGVMVCRR